METRTLLAHIGLDAAFGDEGLAVADASVFIAALDGGKTIAVGGDGATRLNPNGSIDPTFFDEGAAQAALGKMKWTIGDALVSGERLYLSGVVRPRKPDLSINSDVVFIRALNLSDGSNVEGFGDHGLLAVRITSILPGPTVTVVTRPSLALAPDGGIVFAVGQGTLDGTYRSKGVALYRSDARGRLSRTFGGSGMVPVAVNPGADDLGVGIDANGRIIALHDEVHWSSGKFSALLPDGSVDETFGDGGVARVPTLGGFASYGPMRIQPDGKVILPFIDNSDGGTYASIIRTNADGTADADVFVGLFDGSYFRPAIDDSGRVVAAVNGRIVRLTSDFAPDLNFGDDGFADLPPGFAVGNVAVDGAGGILIGNADGVSRYVETAPVTLDADGVVRVYGGGDDAVTVAPDGRFLNVTLNGDVFTFRAANVNGLVIDAHGGDNTIDVALDIPVTVLTADGNDDIRVTGRASTSVNSGAGVDTITTGDGDDTIAIGQRAVIVTNGGADHVSLNEDFVDSVVSAEVDTGAGDDWIEMGWAVARVWAGDGNDLVRATQDRQDVTLHGEGGDDTIVGGMGDDVITGGLGNDLLFGSTGKNTIDGVASSGLSGGVKRGWVIEGSLLAYVGTPAHEQVSVWTAEDTGRLVLWNDGDDFTLLNSGVTTIALYGGAGNDLLKLHPNLNFPGTLDGGPGDDSLYGGAMPDILLGGDGTDYLFGRAGGDELYGAGGNDELHGDAGEDYLEAGAGNDVLLGDAGADTLLGLAGNDRFFAADGARDQLSGGLGTDSADADADDVLANIELT
jgi:Ca2+-binding RTX toxin-like protein